MAVGQGAWPEFCNMSNEKKGPERFLGYFSGMKNYPVK